MHYLITHNDLDGVACAVLFKKAFGEDQPCYFEGYDTVNERAMEVLSKLTAEDTLFLTDISVNKDVAEKIDEVTDYGNGTITGCPQVLLLDHHKTALWLKDYPWAYINPCFCGARLANIYLATFPVNLYYEFVAFVDDYDRWLHKDPRSMQLNRLLGILGRERFIARFLGNPRVEFTETEQLLLELQEEKVRNYIENCQVIKVMIQENKKYGICFAEQFISELGNHLLLKEELDCIAIVDLQKRNVHLRSGNDEVDVSEIAKRRGGGGHPKAAGYQIDTARVIDIIKILDLWEGKR